MTEAVLGFEVGGGPFLAEAVFGFEVGGGPFMIEPILGIVLACDWDVPFAFVNAWAVDLGAPS